MSTETTKKKIKIDNGTEFARVYTDKEVDSKLSGLSSDTAIITLTAEQVQSLSQFEITFTQEQATLLEKATSFKFYYAGNEIAHGQCGKIIQGNLTVYGLSMILGHTIVSGLGSSFGSGRILDYKEKIILAAALPYGAVSNVRADIRGNVLCIDRYANNNVFLDSTSTPKTTSIYLDKINGKSIMHEDSTINNYDLGKSINIFGNHSILVPNSSTDTAINLYNHFIKITGTKDTTQVIARFTIQSSNNLVVDSLTDLYTLLGNEFEIGCSGLFGENNLTGLRKTTEGVLGLIYNNAGAESLQSVAGLTISISDKVKTV